MVTWTSFLARDYDSKQRVLVGYQITINYANDVRLSFHPLFCKVSVLMYSVNG